MSALVFVYNADSGVWNGLRDWWHKAVRPKTYDCQLCAVTYGPLGMKREWRDFVRGLGREVRFLHRDEFVREFGVRRMTLPAAFEILPDGPHEWISSSELRACRSLEELMAVVRTRLAELAPVRLLN